LCSGWWGLATHWHYVPEILVAFFQAVPAGIHSLVPYLYTIFLTGLLVHRVGRDELRCSHKYGKYWEEYRKIVPHRLIPFIY